MKHPLRQAGLESLQQLLIRHQGLAAVFLALLIGLLETRPLLGGVKLAPTFAERLDFLKALMRRHPKADQTAEGCIYALDPDASGGGEDVLARLAFDWLSEHHGAGEHMNAFVERANLYVSDPDVFVKLLERKLAPPSVLEDGWLRVANLRSQSHPRLFSAMTTRVSGARLVALVDALVEQRFMHEREGARVLFTSTIARELGRYAPEDILEFLRLSDGSHLAMIATTFAGADPPDWLSGVFTKLVDRVTESGALSVLPILATMGTPDDADALARFARQPDTEPAVRDAALSAVSSIRLRHNDDRDRGMLTLSEDPLAGGLSASEAASRGDLAAAEEE